MKKKKNLNVVGGDVICVCPQKFMGKTRSKCGNNSDLIIIQNYRYLKIRYIFNIQLSLCLCKSLNNFFNSSLLQQLPFKQSDWIHPRKYFQRIEITQEIVSMIWHLTINIDKHSRTYLFICLHTRPSPCTSILIGSLVRPSLVDFPIHLPIYSFVRSCVSAFVCSCVRLFVCSFVRLFVRLFVRSVIRSFTRSFLCSFVRWYDRSLVLLLVRSFGDTIIRSFVRLSVLSFARWFMHSIIPPTKF